MFSLITTLLFYRLLPFNCLYQTKACKKGYMCQLNNRVPIIIIIRKSKQLLILKL